MAQYKIDVVVDPSGAERGGRRAEQSLNRVDNTASKLTRSMAGLFAGFSAIAAVQQLVSLSDKYTDLTNSLRVTGIANDQVGASFDKLLRIANDTLTPIDAITGLYKKASIAAKELGASNSDLLKFVTNVGNALRIQGGSAASASGALLQLGQALGGGTVRAEEFNSILEGAFPIAQAAARGLDAAGGSVSRLRQLVITGKVSSDEFFNAILSQSESLEKQLATAVVTVSQAFTVFNNNLIAYVGRLNESAGVTAVLSNAILLVANNFDTLGKIIQTGVLVGLTVLASVALPAAIAGVKALTLAVAANPIGALALGITTAIAALYSFSENITGAGKVVDELTDTVLAAVDVIVAGFLSLVNSVSPFELTLDDIGNAFKTMGEVARVIIVSIIGLFDLLISSAYAAGAAIADPFNAATAASEAFKANLGTLSTSFQKAYDTRVQQRELAALQKKSEEAERALINQQIAAEQAGVSIDKNAVRQQALLDSILGPIEQAKTQLADLNALYAAGSITLVQYEAAKKTLLKTIEGTTSATGQAVATFQSEIDKLQEANNLLQIQGLERESLNQILSIQDSLKRQLTEAEKEQIVALTEANALLQRQGDILQSIRGPAQEAQANIAAVTALFESGKISVDEYNKSFNKFSLDLANLDTSAAGGVEQFFRNLEETALSSADVIRSSFEALSSTMSDALGTFVSTGKLDFKSFADDIVQQITRIASQALSQQILGAFGGGGGLGGLFGGGSSGGLGALLGFDNGGSMMIGGRGGVDNNVLSLNHTPVAKVSRGEMLNIKRNGSNEGGQDGGKPVNIVMNISTPDANSFGRAQDQILSQMASRMTRAQRRNG